MNVPAKFEVRSFTRSRDNEFGWGCEPLILEKRRPKGVGDGTVRKGVGKLFL